MFSLVLFMAIFLVIGHMPILSADENDTDNSGRDSNSTDDDEDDDSDELNETDEDDDQNETKDDEWDKTRTRERIREGNCTIKIDKKIELKDGKRKEEIKKKIKCADGTESEFELKLENRTAEGKFKEKIKYKFNGEELEVEAEDEIDLEEEVNGTEYQLKARMRNGNFTRIKIMPGTASEIAIERLKALNFTVELKEKNDSRNVPRVVYNIEANKNGRFLGVFKLAMKVSGEIDPETGEVLEINTPWWAFLVTGEDEEVSVDEGNIGNSTETVLANSSDANETSNPTA